ncbi:MAG TPA: flagellar hook-associated protein FlgL [Thermodesulfobacteriota bacterium]|nr:flagellar hook-associated protein FlgL [Deltaproteobacteria bacterium]HNR12078.1 flagellar hook-associated protein FlgL [Thermodesulfobacteriota bacterium]HOC39179.1 flagellar hook-associated protein FlgL [Thermodesulfobacteriota bacterium]
MMRVTNQSMANSITGNLFRNIERLYKTQNIISSTKRINRPSDDPTGMAHVLNYRETIARIEQYQRNIMYGKSNLEHVDGALDTVGTLLTRAKELAVYQATATATAQTRAIAAEEINDIHDQIMQLANTKVTQGYLFAGHQTDTPPYYDDTRLGSQGVDQATFVLNRTETWTISVGSKSFTVDVANGTSLTALRDAIEAADDAAGNLLSAAIVDDGSSSNPDRLVLTANWTSGDQTIRVSGNTSNLLFNTSNPAALIDAAEPAATWAGTSTVSSGGSYSGTTSKTFEFRIASASGTGTVGTDSITIQWNDGSYGEGEITLDATYVPGTLITVVEGLQVQLGAGTVTAGDTFSVDVWHPDMSGEYATYHGDEGAIRIAAGESALQRVNFTGSEVFDSAVDIFEALHELQVALEHNDIDGISRQIEPLGQALEQVATVRAEAGARLNRIEATETHWEMFLLQVTETLSNTEDADLAKVTADLASQEAAYQASLAAAAKVIQPSLIDFLR